MIAAGRLGVYVAGLAVIFTGAFTAAGAVVPEQVVGAWAQAAEADGTEHRDHGSETGYQARSEMVGGLAVEQDGYLLSEVSTPDHIGESGELSFTIAGPDGAPVTAFETAHEQELHLIVVRSDGTQFRHVHPAMDEAGRWSVPWQWEAAGTYRVYADIVPAAPGESLTLTRTVDVAGDLTPAAPVETSTADEVDGFQVSVDGQLVAGSESTVTISVTRNGQPVTTLEPFLGAYGHLVTLREGDLAYLHVHPDGADPVEGETSGPEVQFATTAPSPGRYYLYFDFQVDGQVHTAQFVLDAASFEAADGAAGDGHSGH